MWDVWFLDQILCYNVRLPCLLLIRLHSIKVHTQGDQTEINAIKSKGVKGGFHLMQILGLLGMYFDAVAVFVTNFLLLFRLFQISSGHTVFVKKGEIK